MLPLVDQVCTFYLFVASLQGHRHMRDQLGKAGFFGTQSNSCTVYDQSHQIQVGALDQQAAKGKRLNSVFLTTSPFCTEQSILC